MINFDLTSNPKESKLLCYNLKRWFPCINPVIKFCKDIVEVVQHDTYLGNTIYDDMHNR